MSRTCKICSHRERDEIDSALVSGNESLRDIARRFSVSKDSLFRHRSVHIPEALWKTKEEEGAAGADRLLQRVEHLQTTALDLLDEARKTGDLRTAISAISPCARVLELVAKLNGGAERSADNSRAVPAFKVIVNTNEGKQ